VSRSSWLGVLNAWCQWQQSWQPLKPAPFCRAVCSLATICPQTNHLQHTSPNPSTPTPNPPPGRPRRQGAHGHGGRLCGGPGHSRHPAAAARPLALSVGVLRQHLQAGGRAGDHCAAEVRGLGGGGGGVKSCEGGEGLLIQGSYSIRLGCRRAA